MCLKSYLTELLFFFLGFFFLAMPVLAKNNTEKIEPSYICAQYLATAAINDQGPLAESLQIDAFASVDLGQTWTDPELIKGLMQVTYAACHEDPLVPALVHWLKFRKQLAQPKEKIWDADSTLCQKYKDDPDNTSGFIIWLDGYNRLYNVTTNSILKSDAAVNKFLKLCEQYPQETMLDVMQISLGQREAPKIESKESKATSSKEANSQEVTTQAPEQNN